MDSLMERLLGYDDLVLVRRQEIVDERRYGNEEGEPSARECPLYAVLISAAVLCLLPPAFAMTSLFVDIQLVAPEVEPNFYAYGMRLMHHDFDELNATETWMDRPNISSFGCGSQARVRMVFWLTALFTNFVVAVAAGVMVLLACRPRGFEAHRGTKAIFVLLRSVLLFLVVPSAVAYTVSIMFRAGRTGFLNIRWGMPWEAWASLAQASLAWAFVQVAVLRIVHPASEYSPIAYPQALFFLCCPYVSDLFDTVKDLQFGMIALFSTDDSYQALHRCIGMMNIAVVVGIQIWMLTNVETYKDLWNCYCSVLAMQPKPDARSRLTMAEKLIPMLYRQMTPAKVRGMMFEDLPQAILATIFSLSLWHSNLASNKTVIVLNIVLPGLRLLAAKMLRQRMAVWNRNNIASMAATALKGGLHKDWLEYIRELLYIYSFQDAYDELRGDFVEVFSSAGFEGRIKIEDGSLTYIDLHEIPLHPEGAAYVASILKSNNLKTLKVLVMTQCEISDTGAVSMADALKVNKTLVEIGLGGNNIGDKGAVSLAEALEVNKSLEQINLRSNKIGSKGSQFLSDALKVNATLKAIHLQENNIGDECAHSISTALEKTNTLQVIVLALNQIGDQGAASLGGALEVNKSLVEINLYSNTIGDKGAQFLSDALKVNGTLKVIHLQENNIGDQGVESIAQALTTNKTLQSIWLQANPIGEAGRKALKAAEKPGLKIWLDY